MWFYDYLKDFERECVKHKLIGYDNIINCHISENSSKFEKKSRRGQLWKLHVGRKYDNFRQIFRGEGPFLSRLKEMNSEYGKEKN